VAWTETAETAALAAAMLAGVGSGVFASLDEACGRMRPAIHRQPPTIQAAAYAAPFATYRRVESRMLS
jgi:sugar (pentulose or hexulose) kinase